MSTLVPVLLFLLAVFATTWTLPLLVRPPTGAESIWAVLVPLLPVVWAPTVIALILIRLYEGQGSLGNELRARLRYERGSGVWLAVAALVPMAALALATLTARATGGQAPWTPVSAIPLMVGVQVVTGAVGEELGWRGYLLPRLRGHLGAVGAGWAMAALWSLWHLPAFFTPGMPHQTMPMHLALLATLFFGVFLAFVFVRAGESIWAPMLAHLSFNIVSGLGGRTAVLGPILADFGRHPRRGGVPHATRITSALTAVSGRLTVQSSSDSAVLGRSHPRWLRRDFDDRPVRHHLCPEAPV